jgi:toxin-antitoxin system PIN domain toxin
MTSARILPDPLSLEQCIERVDVWLANPNTVLLQESKNHWEIFRDILLDKNMRGNITTDAYLAALAISHGATLVSFDNDFRRFQHLRWENPLD